MNKIIMSICAICVAFCVGCKSVPTSDSMARLGTASGITAAYVMNNQVKVDDYIRSTIITTMTEVIKYIPQTNETFCAKWTPMMKSLVDSYVADGKMTEAQATRVVKDFSYITILLDSYVEKKGIKQYQELVDAFIHSFVDSFLKYFKPSVGFATEPVMMDEYTYRFLTGMIDMK